MKDIKLKQVPRKLKEIHRAESLKTGENPLRITAWAPMRSFKKLWETVKVVKMKQLAFYKMAAKEWPSLNVGWSGWLAERPHHQGFAL